MAYWDDLYNTVNQSPGMLPIPPGLGSVSQNPSTQMPVQPGTAFNPGWTNQAVPTGADGKPLLTSWNSLGNEKTGLLNAPYNTVNNYNTGALGQMRTDAMRDPGTLSRWGSMATQNMRNQNALQNAGATSMAQNQLAMNGGIRTGARERIARSGAQNLLQQNQNGANQLRIQDEQNRIGQLQNLNAAELQSANFDKGIQDTNIGRALNEINLGRANQANQWTEAMKAWAAQKTAQATPSGGGKK